MGNPQRYFFNEFMVCRPLIDAMHNTLVFDCVDEDKLCDLPATLEQAELCFYSAPDCIFPYQDGSTNKGEFRRYAKWIFYDVTKVHLGYSTRYAPGISYVFNRWEGGWYSFNDKNEDDLLFERNVPLGRFCGMTDDEIRAWKQKTHFQFKNDKLQTIVKETKE